DAVVVADHGFPGDELDPADLDDLVHFALTGLGALARVRAQRFDTEVHFGEHGRIAHRTVHHDSAPAVGTPDLSDHVTDQRGVQRSLAVDHQDLAVAGFGEHLLQQGVVLEAGHRADPSGNRAASTEIAELDIAAADLRAFPVRQVSR